METRIEFNTISLLDGFWAPDRCWSEIPYGWALLIGKLHLQLKELAPHYKIDQVKEKFGGLRFYVTHVPLAESKEFYELISKAESESYNICMDCGAPGTLKKDGWWRTNCERCETQLWQERHNRETYRANQNSILSEIIPGLKAELEALGLKLPQ
jgi:hypothetical protein